MISQILGEYYWENEDLLKDLLSNIYVRDLDEYQVLIAFEEAGINRSERVAEIAVSVISYAYYIKSQDDRFITFDRSSNEVKNFVNRVLTELTPINRVIKSKIKFRIASLDEMEINVKEYEKEFLAQESNMNCEEVFELYKRLDNLYFSLRLNR